jgi:hypothetical protein
VRRFIDRGGQAYICRDARELIAAFHRKAFVKADSDQAFMEAMAERATLFTGVTYRTDTFEHFVADLLATGLLTEEAIQ